MTAPSSTSSTAASRPEPEARLRETFEKNQVQVFEMLCHVVYRANLARSSEEVASVAEDLLGDVYRRAMSSAPRFDPTRGPMGWLYQHAVYAARDWQRERTRGLRIQYDSVQVENHFETMTRAVAEMVQSETAEQIEWLFARLSATDRQILELRYLRGLTGAELAQAVGKSENATRQRLHRAIQNASQVMVKGGQS